jgi:hypothetical protein
VEVDAVTGSGLSGVLSLRGFAFLMGLISFGIATIRATFSAGETADLRRRNSPGD